MNAWTGIICAFVSAANQGEPVVSGMSAVYLVDDVAGEQWCQKQWTGERCQPRLQMSHEQGALSDVRSPYCRANEMATHCTQRCCKILSLWWLARCDISAGVILRWNTKTRSSEKIKQNWLSKQTLQTRFFQRYANSIVKFGDTVCFVAISSRCNLHRGCKHVRFLTCTSVLLNFHPH